MTSNFPQCLTYGIFSNAIITIHYPYIISLCHFYAGITSSTKSLIFLIDNRQIRVSISKHFYNSHRIIWCAVIDGYHFKQAFVHTLFIYTVQCTSNKGFYIINRYYY